MSDTDASAVLLGLHLVIVPLDQATLVGDKSVEETLFSRMCTCLSETEEGSKAD